MQPIRICARWCGLTLVLLASLAGDARACRIGERERRVQDTAWPGYLIDSAAAIVRARAVAATPVIPTGDGGGENGQVTLAVVEWLRADRATPPDSVRVDGMAVATDDSNPGPVPYRAVRWAGEYGGCYALQYRLGAEYLLLLRRAPESARLTPYWSPLAPVNEQVRGAGDPWVVWVRARAGVHPPA